MPSRTRRRTIGAVHETVNRFAAPHRASERMHERLAKHTGEGKVRRVVDRLRRKDEDVELGERLADRACLVGADLLPEVDPGDRRAEARGDRLKSKHRHAKGPHGFQPPCSS